MNELNLSISTGKENSNKVVLTAAFDNHDEAVAFHSAIADLCNKSKKAGQVYLVPKSWAQTLLPKS